ncbi:hypothetical protein ACHAXS_012044 [Conticribra weissflogii]
MSNPITSWDNDYARLARASAQLRTTSTSSNSNSPFHPHQRSGQAASIQAGLTRLENELNRLEGNLTLGPGEVKRRRGLLDGLRGQIGGVEGAGTGAGSGPGAGRGESATATALRQQDDMIDELAVGVGRLKNQTHLIHQEANSHVRLLDEMDANVDLANQGLEDETRRAMRLREETSVWRLHLVIVGLSILLFLLILMGLS